MTTLLLVAAVVFFLAVVMTMAGRGGGNFYVLVLVLAGMPMHQAAATGQFILLATAVSAFVVFQKHRVVVWHLALLIGSLTASAAFVGGYGSHGFSGHTLKFVFSGFLALAGILMLIPFPEAGEPEGRPRFLRWRFSAGGRLYEVDLRLVVPVTVLSGFGSGMVGVSGGSFLVPLMVLACRVPVRIAVGTASTLIGATALMGFTGHALRGDFHPAWAVPLAAVTVVGGALGGRFALKSRPKHLKLLFAVTTLIAAGIMLANALRTT